MANVLKLRLKLVLPSLTSVRIAVLRMPAVFCTFVNLAFDLVFVDAGAMGDQVVENSLVKAGQLFDTPALDD